MTDKHTPIDAAEQLEKGKILPLVFKLTVPAVIAQLITFVYNVVDRMFVARIDGSGMDALAALGIVLPVTLISSGSAARRAQASSSARTTSPKPTGYSTPRSYCSSPSA